jgi:tRNA threonylcarbamoyladenosine biosynthesis protein TsaB
VSAGPVLALDASTLRPGVALLGPDGQPWGCWQPALPEPGTANLAGAVADLLEARGLAVRDLLGVAVGVGPGSYTGSRAAVALARALAFASGIRIAGVVSSAAAARGALRANPDTRLVLVLLDARRGEAYRSDWERGDVPSGGVVGAEGVPLERAPPRLVSGADADPQPQDSFTLVLREPVPDPYDVAAVGRLRLLVGGDPPEAVRPLYLKRSHAEIVFDERVGSQGLGRD